MPTRMLWRIGKYSGLDIKEVLDLPYSLFLLLNRDSWIESFMESENGRELLKTIWTLQQTDADLEAVRKEKGGAVTWQMA